MSIEQEIATSAGKRRHVRRLFATIAHRYDWITVILSYGRDRAWKRRLIEIAAASPGTRALDLATGTGDIAFAVQERVGRVVVGLDITEQMIVLAARKARRKRTEQVGERVEQGRPSFLVGDMLALPFADREFDLVTTGYGLRNVPDLPQAIVEIFRVLAPGGRMVSLDFNRPSNRFVRAVYLLYLTVVGSTLGWLLHRDPDTYRYIPASIRQYPGAVAVAALMEAHGFSPVRCYPLLGGLMTIHLACKPAVPCA